VCNGTVQNASLKSISAVISSFLAHFEAENKLYSMYTSLVDNLLSVGLIVMPENQKSIKTTPCITGGR